MVAAEIPASTKEAYKAKYGHGKISEDIRRLFDQRAYGENLEQRSRLEDAIQRERDELEELKRKRREINTEIDNKETIIQDYERKISNLTASEERYEAKLEELERRIRDPENFGHLTAEDEAVVRIADESNKEPEGVIRDLKDRNPDVPDYAFEPIPPMGDRHPIRNPAWEGVPEEDVDTPVSERERKHR